MPHPVEISSHHLQRIKVEKKRSGRACWIEITAFDSSDRTVAEVAFFGDEMPELEVIKEDA